VIACELLCACQAIDMLAPLRSSAPLMRVHDFIRARVPVIEHDRSTSHDLAQISAMIAGGDLERACAQNVN
jgi:histidine ammonia-lyase